MRGTRIRTTITARGTDTTPRLIRLATGCELVIHPKGHGAVEVETRNPAGETISTVTRSGDAARRLLLTLAAAVRHG
ncbi:hypothetical protein ACFW5K_19965 [Streptomyces albidoflavus]